MNHIKALLIGLGNIGCSYDLDVPFKNNIIESSSQILTHARALSCHPCFQLVAGIDSSETARKRFTNVYHVPSYPSLLEWKNSNFDGSRNVDLVILAVPPLLQFPLLEELLAFISPRLILLEKPVAFSSISAEKILNLSLKLQIYWTLSALVFNYVIFILRNQ